MLNFILDQAGVDAGIPNHSGHTVLHLLLLFDDEVIQNLVPKLAQRRADLQREAVPMSLGSKNVILKTETRCCSILNAILHGNLPLLNCLLEAAHVNALKSQCHICEAASRFRKILAVSLSIFQAGALTMLVDHVKDKGHLQDIGIENIKVWDGSNLLPLSKVPFNNVAIRSLDLPDSLFRAINYGRRYIEVLEETITFLLSNEKNVESLAYSMITEAVERNNWEAVRLLIKEGEKRRFPKSWWMRYPIPDSPFMRSVSLGFREIFQLFLEIDSTLLQRMAEVPCWKQNCQGHLTGGGWDRYIRVLWGHSEVTVLPAGGKTHRFNTVQWALWLSIDSSHQDYFFVKAILDAADPEYIMDGYDIVEPYKPWILEPNRISAIIPDDEIWVSSLGLFLLQSGNEVARCPHGFLKHAILSSVFSPAAIIVDRFPGVFATISDRSHLYTLQSLGKSICYGSSRVSILWVLRRGSYRQCRFVMERLLPLRTHRSSGNIENEFLSQRRYNSQEEGVQQWTRCPLSREEYDQLVTGNIRTNDRDRKDLWNVVETQVKLGHSRSDSYLRQAILYGNHEALDEMLRQGWNPNGPLWHRLYTPLQYIQSLTGLQGNFSELFKAWNPDLPQTGWMDSSTHAAVYEAYRLQQKDHNWNEWKIRLKASEDILQKHGGRILPIIRIFAKWKPTLCAWAFIAFVLAYGLLLPLTFTYATEHTWTSMSRGQKLGFSYLWSVLSVCIPPIFLIWDCGFPSKARIWISTGLLVIINQIILPMSIIQLNWRPFLSCNYTINNTGADSTCNLLTKCTNYSYLLPLAMAVVEGALFGLIKFIYKVKRYRRRI